MSVENKTLSGDFGGDWNQSQFGDEINADSNIAKTLVRIDKDGDNISILFNSTLSSAERTALNNLILAHTPLADIGDGLYADSTSLSSSTRTSYQQKLRLSMSGVCAGEYFVRWAYTIGNTDPSKPTLVKVEIDDTTVLGEHGDVLNSKAIRYKSFSGFAKVNLTGGTHNIDIDYACTVYGGSAYITNARLWVTSAH